MKMRPFLQLLLLSILTTASTKGQHQFGSQTSGNLDCQGSNATGTSRLVQEFKTDMVHNEFIVKFSGFYKNEARRNFIAAALSFLDGESYEVMERNNPMAAYPSDFDVLLVTDDVGDQAVKALKSHPLIKSITPQRRVVRSLKAIPEDSPKDNEEAEYETKWIKGRRSLSFGSSFWHSVGRHSHRKLLRAVPRQITAILQADILWEMGVTGQGVRVAIFDTGKCLDIETTSFLPIISSSPC